MKPTYIAIIAADGNLTNAAKDIEELSKEIKLASAGDFKLAMKTKESMLILFASEVPLADLAARMKGLAFRTMRYALFSTDGLVAGFLDAGALEWMAQRMR